MNSSAVPKPAYQPIGVCRVSTIALILSVTVPKVCPGAITGGRAGADDRLVRIVDWAAGCRPPYSPSSGFTFRTAARYVVRGRVLSSASSA